MSTQYQNKGISRDVILEEWGINISKNDILRVRNYFLPIFSAVLYCKMELPYCKKVGKKGII